MGVVDLGRQHHHTIRLQLPQPSHSSRLGWQTVKTRVLAQRQGVADMLMGPLGADPLDGDSGEGEVVHPHVHNRSLRHRCMSNNVVVAARPLYQEGEDSIRGDEGGVKCQQPPLDLVLVYLHNIDQIFSCFTFYVKYVLRLCTLMRNSAVGGVFAAGGCSRLNGRIWKRIWA